MTEVVELTQVLVATNKTTYTIPQPFTPFSYLSPHSSAILKDPPTINRPPTSTTPPLSSAQLNQPTNPTMPPSLPCPVCAIDLSSLCPSSACIDHLSLCLRSREVPANNINIPEIVITPPDAPHDLLCNTVTVVDAKLLHAPKRNKFGRAVGVVGRRRKVVSEEEKQGIVGRRLRIETVAKSYERRAWRVHAPRGGNRMHLRRIAARLMRGRGGDEVRRAEAANGSVLAEGMETQAAPSKSEVTDMSPVYNSLEWKDGGSAATNSTPLLEDAQNREEPYVILPKSTKPLPKTKLMIPSGRDNPAQRDASRSQKLCGDKPDLSPSTPPSSSPFRRGPSPKSPR